MSASQSSQSQTTKSIDPASTLPTSATTKTSKTKKSTPYNRDFDLHLTYNGGSPYILLAKARPNGSPSGLDSCEAIALAIQVL